MELLMRFKMGGIFPFVQDGENYLGWQVDHLFCRERLGEYINIDLACVKVPDKEGVDRPITKEGEKGG
jgi:hypothetical protein